MSENGNGNTSKVPTWMLMAALLGGPTIGAGGATKALSSFHEHPDLITQCERKIKYMEWRVGMLELRLPPLSRNWPE